MHDQDIGKAKYVAPVGLKDLRKLIDKFQPVAVDPAVGSKPDNGDQANSEQPTVGKTSSGQ